MDKGSVIHCHFPIIGQLHSIDIAQALVTNISTKGGDAQLADEVAESQSTPHVNSTFRIMWREAESKEHRRRSLQNFVRVHHNHFLFLWTERRVHPFGGRVSSKQKKAHISHVCEPLTKRRVKDSNGSITLRVLLFIRPASKARRDATPLRLISWLSYKLNPELEQFIEQAMEHLSTWKETEGGKVLTMGKDAIRQGETINSEVELRDRLIDLVSVGNLKHKPEALFTLFRQFLTRISLPRLIHFLDLVLPQLMPVQAAWAGEEKTLWSCHHIRWLREKQSAATPRVHPARSSMTQRLSPCSYLSSGSTPFTERCLTQLPGIDPASLWSYDERLVGW